MPGAGSGGNDLLRLYGGQYKTPLCPAPCVYGRLRGGGGGAFKGGCQSFSAGKYEVICISRRTSALYDPPKLRKGRYEDQFPRQLQLGMGFWLKGRIVGGEAENRRCFPDRSDHTLGRQAAAVGLSPRAVRVFGYLCGR